MTDALRRAIRDAARSVPIRLGPNALDIAQRGGPIYLNGGETDQLVDAVMAVLERELTALPDGRLSRPGRDRLELALIRQRRDAGQTWREIAGALGMNSPQVAHARFGRLVAREAEQQRQEGAEPKCSECGGRPKRGLIRSEDGQTWQCEGCYHDELARGSIPDEGAS